MSTVFQMNTCLVKKGVWTTMPFFSQPTKVSNETIR